MDDLPYTPPVVRAWYEKNAITFVIFSYCLWIRVITHDINKQRKLRKSS